MASADFSNGGNLVIRITGFGTPGVNYDQLNVSGALALGGSSVLTLNLAGLTSAGTAAGIILVGSQTGPLPFFHQIVVINNPNNFSVQVSYNAASIDVKVVAGTPAPPVTLTSDIWTGAGGTGNWSTPTNWARGAAPIAGDDLVFPVGPSIVSTTDDFAAGTSFHSITISGNGYTLGGTNSLTLVAGLTTTNASGSNTISMPLVLGGNETFVSTYGTTTLTVSGTINTTFNCVGQQLTVDGTGSTTVSGTISGLGSLVKKGAGTLALQNSLNSYLTANTTASGRVTRRASSDPACNHPHACYHRPWEPVTRGVGQRK